MSPCVTTLTPHQRIFLLAAEAIGEFHHWLKYRKSVVVGYPSPNWISVTQPLHPALPEYHHHGNKEILRAQGPRLLLQNSVFWRGQECRTQEVSTMWLPTQDLQRPHPWTHQNEWRKRSQGPTPRGSMPRNKWQLQDGDQLFILQEQTLVGSGQHWTHANKDTTNWTQ